MTKLNDQVKRCQYVTEEMTLSDTQPSAVVDYSDMGLLADERPDAVVPILIGVQGNVNASMVRVDLVGPTSAVLVAVPTPAAGTSIVVCALVLYTHSILGDHQDVMPHPRPPVK